mgnify:CR=1 FL=1|jgi:tetratricopeptide (TPR) repeat protein|tara:strand:- start:5290 stop:5706 length:417 start_codon:yes stop_codon:yes gene_type:complete
MIFNKVKEILGYGSEKNKKLVDSPIGNASKSIKKSYNRFIIDLRLMMKKSKKLSESNFKLGNKYYKRGEFGEAAFRFTILIKLWPDYYEGYFMLAKSLVAQNKFKKAEKILNKLIRRKPVFKDRAIELLYGNNKVDYN